MKKSILICGGTILMLAACDSGGGSEPSFENAYAFDSYAEGLANFAQLTADSLPQDDLTDRSDLPAGGSATYDGVINVELDNAAAEDVFGTVRLTANFATNGLTGSAGSFVNDNDEAVDGSLSITDGTFLPIGSAGGTAEIDGTIAFDAGPMVVDATALIGFVGDTGQYNFGVVDEGNGKAQPSVGDAIDVDIIWIAERQ